MSNNQVSVPASALMKTVEQIFVANGASPSVAAGIADSLVSADLEGVSSHGVMLVPMYVERVRAGSVSLSAEPIVVEDHGGLVVMSAEHALGQVSSRVAVELASARAREHGVAVVAVRHAFHFGAAAYWVRQLAEAGMVGFALSNTRPLMPAPGGAERVVGNNPMAIGFPSGVGEPLVVDMAMSATAMGKIRLAEAQGNPIPAGWATNAEGAPTTSATDAIAGMLLPAAGPKGFGLAVAVDLLCGALSGGSVGAQVQPLYGRPEVPYDCAHAFIAIDARRVGAGAGIAATVSAFANTIRDSRKAPGVNVVYAPGDLERARRTQGQTHCSLPASLADQLQALTQQAAAPADL